MPDILLSGLSSGFFCVVPNYSYLFYIYLWAWEHLCTYDVYTSRRSTVDPCPGPIHLCPMFFRSALYLSLRIGRAGEGGGGGREGVDKGKAGIREGYFGSEGCREMGDWEGEELPPTQQNRVYTAYMSCTSLNTVGRGATATLPTAAVHNWRQFDNVFIDLSIISYRSTSEVLKWR